MHNIIVQKIKQMENLHDIFQLAFQQYLVLQFELDVQPARIRSG
jgi:hypothetical protein